MERMRTDVAVVGAGITGLSAAVRLARAGARVTLLEAAPIPGGGVRLDITEKVYVKPDARALLVVGGGDTYTVGSFSVSLGYRF